MTSARRSSAPSVVLVWAAAALLAACGSPTGGESDPTPAAVLTAPAGADDEGVEEPVRNAQLEPGTRYRYEEILPSTALELSGPAEPVYTGGYPGVIGLSPDADFRTDSLYIADLGITRVPDDPYLALGDIASEEDIVQVSQVAPDDVLAYAAALPFVEVVVEERSLTVAGVEGRAVDLRVGELPADAQRCGRGSGVGLSACAVLILPPGIAPLAQSGQNLRLIQLQLPAGSLLLYQNLDLPQGQEVVDSLSFVGRPAASQTTD